MRRLRALDLFCCGGGASMGLYRAGFDVTGIDHKPQPKYPFRFIQGDATNPPVDLAGFDFVWASPPCQAFTSLRNLQTTQHGRKEYPNLIPATRALLVAAGTPYCIENVPGAPLGDSGHLLMLCGSMFDLHVPDGSAELRRHRYFETSFPVSRRPQCKHGNRESLSVTGNGLDSNSDRWKKRKAQDQIRPCISVVGYGSPRVWNRDHANSNRRAITITGATPQTNEIRNLSRRTFSINDARAAMGISWLPMKWLSQAIPPAYSAFIACEWLATARTAVA
ncbi:MAG TPA: DNA cytosine methyltransferase [Acidobacteriaceae bacterium]|jgi:DNA (cytosine-5)-methyltransferase 1|nr:DNA cytosine methyltransferase [Acidobacteriaceae bacterium]